MSKYLHTLLIAAAVLALAPARAAAQESFVHVAVSPNADTAFLARADTSAVHALHMVLRDRQRWGKPDADVSSLAPFFAEDALLLGRFGEIYRGRDEILRFFQRMLGFGEIQNMRLTLGAKDGLIYVTGRYRHLIHRADGRGRFYEDLGSYAWVWERQRDGQWRIQSMMMIPEPNPGSPANPYQ
ncbi:YybH family protein [Longimicrobium sp.]|jgi:ketosteroid isomerase-like protein|uniref:YybH family protein n=1 Tax=Longimicrobium sp. TaxID=2029185 RepID=UPI002F9282C3